MLILSITSQNESQPKPKQIPNPNILTFNFKLISEPIIKLQNPKSFSNPILPTILPNQQSDPDYHSPATNPPTPFSFSPNLQPHCAKGQKPKRPKLRKSLQITLQRPRSQPCPKHFHQING